MLPDAPREFEDATAWDNPRRLHKWLLEDLSNEFLTTPRRQVRAGRQRLLNCRTFRTVAALYNEMKRLQDAEAAMQIARDRDVLAVMPKYAHRQFEWQHGFANRPGFYRSAFIFGQGRARDYFVREYGITPADFMLFGMAAWAAFTERSAIRPEGFVLAEAGISREIVDAGLALAAADILAIRHRATSDRRGTAETAYKRSALRRSPIVSFADGALTRAPLPSLIIDRVTNGLYLDLVAGPSELRTEMGRLFEEYCLALVSRTCGPGVRGSFSYGTRSRPFATPDILVDHDGALEIVVECKATRMSFDARFADNRAAAVDRGYGELAKGIGQIWRFASHIRRGLVTQPVSGSPVGCVLTLDPWLRMTAGEADVLFTRAQAWAREFEPGIETVDQWPIAFVHVEDLEQLVQQTDTNGVLAVLRHAAEPASAGWGLNELRPGASAPDVDVDYPFGDDDLQALLPWWKRL